MMMAVGAKERISSKFSFLHMVVGGQRGVSSRKTGKKR